MVTDEEEGASLPALSPTRSNTGAPPSDYDADGYDELPEPAISAEPIRVVVRVRPLADPKLASFPAMLQVEGGDTLRVLKGTGGSGSNSGRQSEVRVRFDSVLDPNVSQSHAYSHVGPAVESALGGLNSTVFAYGQTGSGKTHTLFGGLLPGEPVPPCEDGAEPIDTEGMASRALRQIFARATQAAEHGLRLAVTCSFLEVYNEHLTDLLLPPGSRSVWGGGAGGAGATELSLHEDQSGEVFVRGLSEVPVHTIGQALALVRRALRGRHVRQTDMNARSSRSHAVLQVLLEQAPSAGATGAAAAAKAVRAKLNLVDLAGSERAPMNAAGTPDLTSAHKREMGHINKSLSALANCIAALSEKSRAHVPYRDSVLTRLLQASLGGNARTLLIATVSPADKCVDESLSTLRFADRAKHVMLRATVNPTDIGDTLVQQRRRFEVRIERLTQEVHRLKNMLEARDVSRRQPPADSYGMSGSLSAREARDGGGADVQALMSENEKLRRLLRARDVELAEERAERQRLQAIVDGGGAPARGEPPADSRAPPREPRAERGSRPDSGPPPAADAEADMVLREVMEELRLQESELERIRAEEREIEALLAMQSKGNGPRQAAYGGGGLPGGGAYSTRRPGDSPRQRAPDQRRMPRDPVAAAIAMNASTRRRADDVGLSGSMPAAFSKTTGYGAVSPRDTWQPPPAAHRSSGYGAPQRTGGVARKLDVGDPHSVHYDPRADKNSRYYDPECDPNSRWYNPGRLHDGTQGGGGHGGGREVAGHSAYHRAQPQGSAWTGAAYGMPPKSAGPPPRSAPPPAAADPHSPPPNSKRSGGRSGRRGNKNHSSTGAIGTSGASLAASAVPINPTDVGSLYYVLGAQASSSRVKQLQQMLAARRQIEQHGQPPASPRDNSVAERLEL